MENPILPTFVFVLIKYLDTAGLEVVLINKTNPAMFINKHIRFKAPFYSYTLFESSSVY